MESIRRLKKFMADPLSLANELSTGSERVRRVYLGPQPFVFVFSPEAAQEVLTKRASIYRQSRKVFDRIQPVTGQRGLVQLEGESSRRARTETRPMFSTQALQSAQAVTETFAVRLVEELREKDSFDAGLEMNRLILATALKIFLGVDSSETASLLGSRFQRLNILCGKRMRSLLPIPLFVPTAANREIHALASEIRTLLTDHLRTARFSEQDRFSLPSVLKGHPDLIDHCMTFMFAGHETTASSIAFSLLLLAQNPTYQDAVAAGDESMIRAIYKESLRLFPPAYMLAREACSADDLHGTRVRKSDQVVIAVSSLHRDPLYFPEPDRFRPKRFLEGAESLKAFSFLPFGAGQKSCVGEKLAFVEAAVVLRAICETYRLSNGDAKILADPHITLNARPGQRITLTRR